MNFFNTFSEISKNQNNFRQYEQDKANEDAQRAKHFSQNPASEKDLQEAKEFGRVVVDTVEFMDTKSENKSEAVETTAETATGLASVVATVATAIGVIKSGVKDFKDNATHTESLRKKFVNLKRGEHDEIIDDLLNHNLIEESGLGKDYKFIYPKRSLFGYKIVNKKRFEALSDKTKAHFNDVMTEDMYKVVKRNKTFLTKLSVAPVVAAFVVATAGQIMGTIAQVKASRIARFQAREDLKDARNFVEYTEEQKAEAAKLVNGINVPKTKESGTISDLMSLGKDYAKYQQASAEMDNTHLYDIVESDPEKATQRQQLINNAIKKINNQAEDYSENMETGSGILLGSSLLGGALIGKLGNWIAESVSKTDKDAKKKDLMKQAEEAFAKDVDGVKPSFFKKTGKIIKLIAKASPGTFGSIAALLLTAPVALKLQKDASRAGRYQARKELEQNPENFLAVDNAKLSSTGVTGTVKKDGFLDVVKSLPQSIKASFEYTKYKKTEMQEKKKMNEALKQVNVSDEQIKKAEALKARLYKSFDVIDDHSEEYSEKMEAACEIGKNLLQYVPIVGCLIPGALFVKYPQKTTKLATDAVAFAFSKAKSLSSKYSKDLGENAAKKLGTKIKRDYHYKKLSFAEEDINKALLTTDNAQFKASMQSLEEKFKTKLSEFEVPRYLQEIEDYRAKALASSKVKNGLSELEDPAKLKEMMEEFLPGKSFEETPENIAAWRKKLDDFSGVFDVDSDFAHMKEDDLKKIIQNIKTIKETIPAEDFLAIFTQQKKLLAENPTLGMIAHSNGISLDKREMFVTSKVAPVVYGAAGAWVATLLGGTYAMEAYLSAKTKQAGRIGTMKAIQSLDEENEQAKAKAQPQSK